MIIKIKKRKPTPYIKLINGECLEEMKSIHDGSIDLILTDPPYGTTACKWDSVIPLDPMWEQLKRIIKLKGVILMTAQQPFSSALVNSNIKDFKYRWVWEKDKCGNFLAAKAQPLKYTEDVLVFAKKAGPNRSNNWFDCHTYIPQMVKTNIKRRTKSERFGLSSTAIKDEKNPMPLKSDIKTDGKFKYPKDMIYFTVPHKKQDRVHPTQKPVALMEYLIKTYTNENETVLDFTMGSGTTGVACKNLKRNFIGIELDENYFNIAKERIHDN